ncbi:hypothetical protein F4808DRAFT_217895 [Astrocystis sublimbata]|nr:hypothetical protein F4808DRAFT_217895 [Astrocystis sublimbata]
MKSYAAYTLLVLGLASQTLADQLARDSASNIFGIDRRQVEGYNPTDQLCGEGNTCAEACGKGFRQCASNDDLTHCYNRAKKQICCPNHSGDACDNGYFCSADEANKTWCCPEGMSLAECARKYSIPGPLTSQEAHTSTTSSTSTTSTSKATKTKSAESSATSTKTSTTDEATTSTKERKPHSTATATSTAKATTTTTESSESTSTSKTANRKATSKSESTETTTATPSSSTTTVAIESSSAPVPTEAATTEAITPLESEPASSTTAAPASTTTFVTTNMGGNLEPANALVLLVAGALAALL